MKTLKTYLVYIILIVTFYIFSDVVIYLALNGMYKKIDAKVYTNTPEIAITKCAATNVNGVVGGTIKNNTNEGINNQYIKIDLYSSRNIKMGTKYIAIENLAPEKEQHFEIWYRYSNVSHAAISITNQAENILEEELVSQRTMNDLVLGGLILLLFIK